MDQNTPLAQNWNPVDVYVEYFDPYNGYEKFDKEIAKTIMSKISREDLIEFIRPNLIILNKMIDVSDLIEMTN